MRGLSVQWLAVEFVAVAQQHAEPKKRRRFFLCDALIIDKVNP